MKTMFIGVIIVGIIILAVLLALNLLFSLEGTGIELIMGFDCAENFDELVITSFEMIGMQNIGEGAIAYSEAQNLMIKFMKNKCASSLAEWKDRSEQQFVISSWDWKDLVMKEKQYHLANP